MEKENHCKFFFTSPRLTMGTNQPASHCYFPDGKQKWLQKLGQETYPGAEYRVNWFASITQGLLTGATYQCHVSWGCGSSQRQLAVRLQRNEGVSGSSHCITGPITQCVVSTLIESGKTPRSAFSIPIPQDSFTAVVDTRALIGKFPCMRLKLLAQTCANPPRRPETSKHSEQEFEE